MKIKDIPKEGRPRERFLKLGPEALSDAELFAILLRTGTRGKKGEKGENVIEMSNRLMNEYGLDKLLDCSLVELQKINGIGPAKAMQILTIAELQKRINQAKNPITRITCAEDVFKLFHDRLKNKKEEHFYVLMLDTKNNIIGEQLISKGILDSSIILVHNHPSGDPNPSPEDLDITDKLIKAGEELGIKVLDSVIVGKEKFWSWKENS